MLAKWLPAGAENHAVHADRVLVKTSKYYESRAEFVSGKNELRTKTMVANFLLHSKLRIRDNLRNLFLRPTTETLSFFQQLREAL